MLRIQPHRPQSFLRAHLRHRDAYFPTRFQEVFLEPSSLPSHCSPPEGGVQMSGCWPGPCPGGIHLQEACSQGAVSKARANSMMWRRLSGITEWVAPCSALSSRDQRLMAKPQ